VSQNINPVPDPVTKEEARRWMREANELFWRRPISIVLVTSGIPLLLALVFFSASALLTSLTGVNNALFTAMYLTKAAIPVFIFGGCLLGGMMMAGAADHCSSRLRATLTYARNLPVIVHIFISSVRARPILMMLIVGLALTNALSSGLSPEKPIGNLSFQDFIFRYILVAQSQIVFLWLLFADHMLPWQHHGLIAEGAVSKSMSHDEISRLTLLGISKNPGGSSFFMSMSGGLPYLIAALFFLVVGMTSSHGEFLLGIVGFFVMPYFACFAYACHRERFRGRKSNHPAKNNVHQPAAAAS